MPSSANTLSSLDALSPDELRERHEQTLKHIAAIKALWPGLTQLPKKDRQRHPGRIAASMEKPFYMLFGLLMPRSKEEIKKLSKEEQEQEAQRQKMIEMFNTSLGEEDAGLDGERFEAELLLRRLDRMNKQWQISESLGELARLLDDDALHTGGMVASPGLAALDLVRSLTRNNATFRSLLAPVLDALREMTKAARAKAEEPQG